jgi:CRP-like cAMP-binding protein
LISKLAYSGVAESEVSEILSLGHCRSVRALQEISSPGAEIVPYTVLIEGIACRYTIVGDGRRALIGFILPGDFTTAALTGLTPLDFGILSLTTGKIIEMPCAELETRASNNLHLSQALAWSAMVEGSIARAWLANSHRPADKRLAHLLCELRQRFALVGMGGEHSFDLPLTQQNLGDALGLSTVHVNRMFQYLKGLGLVQVHGHKIVIGNLSRLEHFAEFDPAYLHLNPHKTAQIGSRDRHRQHVEPLQVRAMLSAPSRRVPSRP